ncbi:MAG: exodeoxyribonuclease VII large subunit [Chlorobi bacterium]|nr:exodeoxyribonuclease VII large subunit [Chlorobiota bacterium]
MDEHVLTVTLLTQAIRQTLEGEFALVHVIGEISNYKRHQSGHRYFTLKDEGAQIRCVLWRGRPVPVELSDGMQVKVRGRLSVYPLQGNYQIDCFSVLPAGIGDLYAAFEQLKRELAAAGYFDQQRKRSLPRLPRTIGIATSPTGAALRDMITTLERRNPSVTVVFRPTLVQGIEAAEDVAHAIAELNTYGCDVIIVGRGGGSLEDLWAFNTRTVADAIFHSQVPIVSAVGHETDVTIADFVADVRAATPTAAAELCTPIRREDLLYWLDEWSERTSSALLAHLADIERGAKEFTSPVTVQLLLQRTDHAVFRTDRFIDSITSAIMHTWARYCQQLDHAEHALSLMHPLQPLERGFALVERDGVFLTASDRLRAGDRIRLHRRADLSAALVTETTEQTQLPETDDGKAETNH